MSSKTKNLIINIAIPLFVGAVSAFISRDGMQNFENIVKPPLSPPAILFPIVWTILFILMGIAAYLVSTSKSCSPSDENALTVYYIQLAVNFFWSIFFFKFDLYLFSFFWLILLWVLIIITFILFRRISKTASNLLIPYLLWVTFAGYLNLGIALLN
ncbi:MAG: tryptophan-rich sensory protein [Firmicutes bacterium]|nr:tryptophan-rich sensory protein [Bacillota bacterium]